MTDYTHDGGDAPRPSNPATLANWAGAAVSLALIVGVGIWSYRLVARDVSGVPEVAAMDGPMRVTPEDPGGTLADHQGLAVNRVAGTGAAAPPPDRLVLAPRPAGLSEEDVALGVLVPQPEEEPKPAAAKGVAPEPGADAPEPATTPLNGTASDDPLRALVDQLTAGARPLSAPDPGEDAPVVTELAEPVPEAEAADPLTDSDGLARSLRPRPRPQGLQVASLETATDAARAPADPGADEVDPESLAPGTRLVQIGAFDSPETARTEWQRLAGRFGDYLDGKDRVIQRASSGGRVFYRLRAHGFADLSDARRFCAAFVAGGVDCIPVATR